MHTVVSENYSGGAFKSLITGKIYNWTRSDNTGASRKAALQEMQAANNEAIAAAEARVGRKLTTRELIHGVAVPDTRSPSERIRQDAQVKRGEAPSPDQNPYTARIADLKADLARTTNRVERNKIESRLRHLEEPSQKWDAQRAAEVARETLMSSSEVQTAIVHGTATVALLQNKSTIPQSWYEKAKQNLLELKQTGNTDKFWAEYDAYQAERKAFLETKTQSLDAEAKLLREESAAVRREDRADVKALAEQVQSDLLVAALKTEGNASA